MLISENPLPLYQAETLVCLSSPPLTPLMKKNSTREWAMLVLFFEGQGMGEGWRWGMIEFSLAGKIQTMDRDVQ